jgi:chromosome segregation ATPase
MKNPMRIVREIVDPVDRSDPARQALAAAIAEATTAASAAAQARDALGRAETYLVRARHAHDEATALLERATAEQAEKLAVEFASGAAPASTSLVKTARERLASAADDVESMKGAISHLRQTVTEADDELARAKRKVTEAMRPVVTQVAPALMAAAERAQHQYVEAVALLHAAARNLHFQSAEYVIAANFIGRSNDAVASHLGGGKSESAAKWRAAIEALSRDAYALLPTGEVH